MKLCPYRLASIALFTLLLGTTSVLAQENKITVVGSGIVQPVLQTLIENSETEAEIEIKVTGSTTGFTQFCAGEADITTSTRAITTAENTACIENNVRPLELVIGQHIYAFITHPETDTPVCLTAEELSTLYAPSTVETVTNWNQVIETAGDQALTIYAPDDFTADFAVLDTVIEGDGIRADVNRTDDAVASVSQQPGAIGFTSLKLAQEAGASVRILELDAAQIRGCQAPEAAAAEDDLYPAAEKLYVYTSAAALENSALANLLAYTISADAATLLEDNNVFSPTDILAAANRTRLENAATVDSQTNAEGFSIPVGVSGTVNIAGAGEGQQLLNTIQSNLNLSSPGITPNIKVLGQPAGFRSLCNGAVDFIYTTREPNTTEIENCAANEINLQTITLGNEAVVLLANAEDEAVCLTPDQVANIWKAQESPITTWNELDSSYPQTEMTLFAPLAGHADTDLLLLASAPGTSLNGRVDVNLNSDPLYRAAATANVPGALTFMNWQDYQRVLSNNQANIQLVGIDAGNECITPDVNNIRSGDYPLVRTGYIVINENQLGIPAVQSFLWSIFLPETLPTLENAGFVGLRLSDMKDIRDNLADLYNDAALRMLNVDSSDAEAEATTDETVEATVEAEATQDADPTEEPAQPENEQEESTETEATQEVEATEEAE